jgi:phosphatidate phosphatase PAH1
MRIISLLSAVLLCGACTTSKEPSIPITEALPAKAPTPPSSSCGVHPFTPKAKGEFKHKRSALVAAASPAHAGLDALFAQGNPITLKAKFAYGDVNKDLEDEPIETFIELCEGWRSLGETLSDDDGRISLLVSEVLPDLPSGVYPVRFQVKGDASVVAATLRIFPKGTHFVAFDIDGTLTTADKEIMKDFEAELLGPLSKGYTPEAYVGGPALTQLHEKRGAQLLYMTGRPYWLTALTREWLQQLTYAPATLKLTDSTKEALPTQSGVGEYKLNFLKSLIAQGFIIDLAYGNAATDIYAYLGAGIDPKNVYIIGKHGGEQGTNAVTTSWEAEVTRVKTLASIEQPK